MPLVTLTARKGKSEKFKSDVLAGVHGALVASGVPEKDRFHRVLELGAEEVAHHVEDGAIVAGLVLRRRSARSRV